MFFYYDEPAEGASDLTICSGSDEKKTSMQGEYTIAELRQVGPLEFRAVPTGNYILTRNGKRKQETVGKEFINTHVGKFELREWYSYMEEAVRREGEVKCSFITKRKSRRSEESTTRKRSSRLSAACPAADQSMRSSRTGSGAWPSRSKTARMYSTTRHGRKEKSCIRTR